MIKIKKRNGAIQNFELNKIKNAIRKAMEEDCKSLTSNQFKIIDSIAEEIQEFTIKENRLFSVEDIQDLVEIKLMQKGLFEVAKRYILYRVDRAKVRSQAWEMTELERGILENRYLQNGETFEEWLNRISAGNEKIKKRIRNKQFLFGGRILANRGMINGGMKSTLSNCYVLQPPKDSIEGIFQTAAEMARTYSYGGGVGISLRDLRPRGAEVGNSAKETSGAVSFMELYDLTTKIIGQAGRRKI